ncbi:MAG: twin-arginine translocase subunit TatC [Spirochaetes bacterium]|nr:twin-arginine translocase subunit TatC [Spirochaetota bacterium]
MQDKELTIVEHLNELRKRLLYIVIVVAAASGGAYYFIDEILLFITESGNIEKLVFINPTEAFFVIVKLSLLAGVMGAMPFILYQIWRYVGVALKKGERKYLIFFGPVSYILFLSGAAFAFRGVLPLAIKFLLSFRKEYVSLSITPMITLNAYISFLSKMIIAFGVMFELPLVILALSKFGIVTPEMLKKGRRYTIVGVFIVAAILTPPDVVSQIMLAIPLLLLYEVGILICKAVTRKREREAEAGESMNEPIANEA